MSQTPLQILIDWVEVDNLAQSKIDKIQLLRKLQSLADTDEQIINRTYLAGKADHRHPESAGFNYYKHNFTK